MEMRPGKQVHDELTKVNWNFDDYNSQYYPLDINNIHWYPASFVPQIPSIMIQFFSNESDVVLDPFCGSGVTLIEAARQNRHFIGYDINPYAIEICKAKFEIVNTFDWSWIDSYIKSIIDNFIEDTKKYCLEKGVNFDVFKWFHEDTLKELLSIHKTIKPCETNYLIKKVAFSSILKSSCSQRKHYTYITDNCYPNPKELIKVNAIDKYKNQLKHMSITANMYRTSYKNINSKDWIIPHGEILQKDTRDLSDINDESIDLIITSPPYLGCNDYLKSMRLTYLFFSDYNIDIIRNDEIGARWKRKRPNAENEYLLELKPILAELKRIIKKEGHIILIMGQGKGRVNKNDILTLLSKYMQNELALSEIFNVERNIMFRRIRNPGADKENILIYKK